MAIVRKAKYRFSTLRSRVMHRSASGSQMGDLQRQSSSLSVQLSGQHPCHSAPDWSWMDCCPPFDSAASQPTLRYALAQQRSRPCL